MKFKNTLKSIFDEFSTEIYCLRETGDLDDELYEATFEYLMNTGNLIRQKVVALVLTHKIIILLECNTIT